MTDLRTVLARTLRAPDVDAVLDSLTPAELEAVEAALAALEDAS